MSVENKIEQFPIKITNFINPHLFQFKLENIVGQFDLDIEQKLRQSVEKDPPAGYNPEQGTMVAAYIVPWGKWVRAEVDLILEEGRTLQYVVWCLDHGVPMRLPSHHLRPIPINLQHLPSNAYFGGLANCEPIEKKLNFAKMVYETHTISDFPEYLVDNAKQMVEEAAEIYFTPRQTMGNQIFGDIRIIKYRGEKVDLLNELVATDNVKAIDTVIPKGIETLKTIKKQRYENHLGHLNIRNSMNIDTTSRVHKSNMSAMSVCTENLDDDDDKKQILDWSRQNSKLAKNEEHKMKTRFENVLQKLDVYELPSAYLYRSSNTINSSSTWNILSRASSTCTVPSEQMSYDFNPPKDHRMNLLTRKFQKASINSVVTTTKSKPKKEPKKTVYIPSGYESDLVNFQKYNQFY